MLTVAFDVGGTKIVGALLDDAGVRHRVERPTPGPAGAADPGSQSWRGVAADLGRLADGPVGRVGVGVCEYVHDGRLTSREVLAWDEQPADWLAADWPAAHVVVESDVRCGLLAEHRWGAARDVSSAAFVSWGTGLSSALLIGGRSWPGQRGRAIALGELPVRAAGAGSLEAYASGAGIARRYADRTRTDVGGAREVLARADEGDPAAVEVASSAGVALAHGLADLVHLVDPELVVLGGGLGSADTQAGRAVRDAWHELGAPVPLVVAQLGAEGPLIGAATAAGWSGRPSVREADPPGAASRDCGTGRP